LYDRAANAVVSYMGYLSKAVWPAGLAVYYPFPESLPSWQVAGSLTAITAVTAACLLLRKRAPYAVVGWLWFLGVMTPMLGLVRHDRWPALADRFAYVPIAGLWIMLAFGLYAASSRVAARRAAAVALAVAVIALGAASRHQLQFWSGSEALYRRALAVTRDNWLAHNNLGSLLYARGDTKEAVDHFKRALKIRPCYGSARVNLGVWRMRLDELAAAEGHFQKATETEAAGSAWQGLADIRFGQGQYDQALGLYQKALHHNPRLLSSWRGRAESLRLTGLRAEAANAYVEAAQRHLDTYRLETALELAEEALALMPGMAEAKAIRQRALNKL
jgi:tetratricopeptide (TPR) repeat protein